MTVRERFDAVAAQVQALDTELRRLAADEVNGHERRDLQRVCEIAMPAIRRGWAEMQYQLRAGAPDAVLVALLGHFELDVAALIRVLRGQLRLILPGEEPN
jgi:hypothetical protein